MQSAAAAAAGESQGNFLFWETAALKQQAVEKKGAGTVGEYESRLAGRI